MNRRVIIIGASCHSKVIADIVSAKVDEVLGYLDDDESKATLGKVEDWKKYNSKFVIEIGNEDIRECIGGIDCKLYTAIHPISLISPVVEIGEGAVIMPNEVINAGARIGKHCIKNTGAIEEHDNTIEDYVHISVGAKQSGIVNVGKETWIDYGAVVNNNISIWDSCMIGEGTVVIEKIEDKGIYCGMSAKRWYRVRRKTSVRRSAA